MVGFTVVKNLNFLRQKKYRPFVATAFLAVVGVVCALGLLLIPVNPHNHTSQLITIARGQSVQSIARDLKSQHLIYSEFFFKLYATALGVEKRLQAGTYKFGPNMSTVGIVDALANGDAESTDLTVTIPEGINVWEIDERLTQVGLITAGDFARIALINEGYYFPDTYRFAPGTLLAEIIGTFRGNFLSKGSPTHQQVIIASLLEKEGRRQEDMEIISGIIQNRLARGMALQLDASVAYGWCVRTTLGASLRRPCDVTQAPIATELHVDGPYNTYSRTGLPLAAIANPGAIALEAAEHPRKTDYLYYLSTRDGSQIIYAKTAAEHAANRKKYLGL